MIDSLMRELKEFVDQKNNLTVELMAKEEDIFTPRIFEVSMFSKLSRIETCSIR
jgi:hypothetical protein